jgi:Fur family ferric uptake transcriptional regulator
MTKPYQTRQKEAIRACLQEAGTVMTAEQLHRRLMDGGEKIGLATVYRQLDRLLEEGLLIKRPDVSGISAGYQYAGDPTTREAQAQLVCLHCGTMKHVDCAFANEFSAHMENDHQFHMDRAKTMFYGTCRACAENAQGEPQK